MIRVLVVVATIAAAAALFLVLRPDDDGGSAAGTTTAATTQMTAPTAPTSTEPPPPPPPPSPPPPARVRIVVQDGQPVGGVRRVTVSEGRRVVLIITSDVSDHVHLHGYDIMRDVGPGRPGRISFRATIVGTVEAELEDRRVRIATVTAQP